jgi:hypothetical protein
LEGILTQHLPVKAAYWLGKFLRKAQQEFQDLDASRIRLCEQYAKKDGKGQSVKTMQGEDGAWVKAKEGYQGPARYAFAPGDEEIVNKQFRELGETEITFDFRPLTLEQLGDKFEATAVEMAALMPFIQEPEEEVKAAGPEVKPEVAAKVADPK